MPTRSGAKATSASPAKKAKPASKASSSKTATSPAKPTPKARAKPKSKETVSDEDEDDKVEEGGEGEPESSELDDIPLTFKEFTMAAKPMKVVIGPVKATNPVEFKANSTQMSTG
jgi:hypothetical protein